MAKFKTVHTTTINCPVCDSDHVVKIGRRDGNQRYLCRGCSKRFYANGNVPGYRFPPKQIGAAIGMFYGGMSFKKTAENMEDMFDIPEPSKRTIYKWVREYTARAKDAMKGHKARTGSEWVGDEMVVRVGGQKYWLWNVMDSKTRYILAAHLSKRRDAYAARAVMRKAAMNAWELPKRIKTDKLRSYISAIEDLFGADVKHVQSEGLAAEINNNLSERLQGTIRDRDKTLRGLDSRESGQAYLDGWVLNYNLFREHESLGDRPPAEAARMNPPFKSWEEAVERTGPRRAMPRVEVVSASPGKPPEKQVEVDTSKIRAAVKPRNVKVNGRSTRPKGATVKEKPAKRTKRAKRIQDTVPLHPFMRPSERGGRKR